MRVLLTGASGQLGTELQRYLQTTGDDVVACSRETLDVADREQTLQIVHEIAPDLIIHAAAMTNVDGCETDPLRAYVQNSLATRNVAEASTHIGAHVLYLSTDYVFDGRGTGVNGCGGYTEWDTPAPISAYGRSKLGGERELQTLLGSRATIVRVSWVCGEFGNNFVKTMLRLAHGSDSPVTVVDDQRGCPTFTSDLVPVLRQLGIARIPGIVHVSNTGPVTWCDFAAAIFSAAGADANRVKPITTSELQPARPAPRPAVSVLEHVALHGLGFAPMPHWESALQATIRALG